MGVAVAFGADVIKTNGRDACSGAAGGAPQAHNNAAHTASNDERIEAFMQLADFFRALLMETLSGLRLTSRRELGRGRLLTWRERMYWSEQLSL